ncbi:nuclear transport factor 2 family protein [Sinimarinibacterium flocculans]|uniref:nuclear transport factor 2 family protein n=1 Tax=Sinimarinibacterium flocculans TaxID=985250 RepID=UPI002493932C|nr:nuclear transport factor 2 family protein [Sinimarinibacterium flocculans]
MKAIDCAEIERQCSQLVAKFALYVDRRRYADVLALFTGDGSFSRPGLSVSGRQQMSAWLDSRPGNWVTCHFCGPTVFETMDAGEARAVTCVTVYQGEESAGSIPRLELPAALVEYQDVFRRTDDGWRIASRNVKPIMAKGAS